MHPVLPGWTSACYRGLRQSSAWASRMHPEVVAAAAPALLCICGICSQPQPDWAHSAWGGAGSRRTGGRHAIRQSVQTRASCRRQRISSSKSCPNTFTSLKRQSPRSASTWRAPCALCLRVQSTLRGTPRDSAEDLQRALLLAREFGRTTPDGLLGACTMSF